jgi:hypothetical protein
MLDSAWQRAHLVMWGDALVSDIALVATVRQAGEAQHRLKLTREGRVAAAHLAFGAAREGDEDDRVTRRAATFRLARHVLWLGKTQHL